MKARDLNQMLQLSLSRHTNIPNMGFQPVSRVLRCMGQVVVSQECLRGQGLCAVAWPVCTLPVVPPEKIVCTCNTCMFHIHYLRA